MSIIYAQAAKVLKSVISRRMGVKSACFIGKSNVKAVYALVQKVLPNYRTLEKYIKTAKTPNKYLAVVMLYDFWATGKISGGGYVKQQIMQNFPNPEPLILKTASKVWVRINNHKPIPNPQILGIKDDLIENLYLADRCKEINELINDYTLIAQSKASCMPVAALSLYQGTWNAVDTCAAPGNKTLQMAERMKKFTTGVLYAYEKDKKRFELLDSRVKSAGFDNIRAQNRDFFDIYHFPRVKIGIVDPSCSGSGIIEHQIVDKGKIHYNINYTDDRIHKLSDFQLKILLKTLKIPGIEQVVYSTCSIYKTENEDVVENALKTVWKTFKLVKTLTQWKDRGVGRYGKYMVRSIPTDNHTQGFFVAKFVKRSLRLRHKILKNSKKHWVLKKTPKYS